MVYTRSMVVSRTIKKLTVEGIPAFLSLLTKLLGPEGWLLVLSPGCLKAFAAAFLNPVSSGIRERQPGRGSADPPSPWPSLRFQVNTPNSLKFPYGAQTVKDANMEVILHVQCYLPRLSSSVIVFSMFRADLRRTSKYPKSEPLKSSNF